MVGARLEMGLGAQLQEAGSMQGGMMQEPPREIVETNAALFHAVRQLP